MGEPPEDQTKGWFLWWILFQPNLEESPFLNFENPHKVCVCVCVEWGNPNSLWSLVSVFSDQTKGTLKLKAKNKISIFSRTSAQMDRTPTKRKKKSPRRPAATRFCLGGEEGLDNLIEAFTVIALQDAVHPTPLFELLGIALEEIPITQEA